MKLRNKQKVRKKNKSTDLDGKCRRQRVTRTRRGMRILSEPPREQDARTKRLRPILGSILGAHSSSEARLNSSSWFPSLAVLECLLAPPSHMARVPGGRK